MSAAYYSQLSMIPKLLASWMAPVHRPRIVRGVHSDTYVGTMALIYTLGRE